jgi:glutathione synthase/RimK-type ligase-like ATP-grasp enzyme
MQSGKRSFKFAVLINHSYDLYKFWIEAIKESEFDIRYSLIYFDSNNWLEEIRNQGFDAVLISPPYMTINSKRMCDERIFIISEILKIPVYPDYKSLLVFENKRMLDYVLDSYEIPHPGTWNFHNKEEALSFTVTSAFPLVAKIITGAAGIGVRFLRNRKDARQYILKAFKKGVRSKTGPSLRRPGLINRFISALHRKNYVRMLMDNYGSVLHEKQIGYVYLQEFIPHEFEWRCVRIDDSYFAHKKLVKNHKASGSLLKVYDKPPGNLLEFVRSVSEKLGITSAAFDIFETRDKGYLVNEVQTFFGQSDPHQMIIDEIPGRYYFKEGEWIFEAGDFNRNKSFNLRLNHAIKLLNRS